MAGKKQTDGKVPLHLISGPALEGLAQVLDFGSKKYEDRNWENGIPYDKIFQALMRHAWKWWSGHTLDSETGLNHIFHVACLAMFLSHFEKCPEQYAEFDNRPLAHSEGVSNDQFLGAASGRYSSKAPNAAASYSDAAGIMSEERREYTRQAIEKIMKQNRGKLGE